MSTIFDITSYGALGDGVTDCTKAIQAAIDDAAPYCGVVAVPPGIYATGRLRLKPGVSIEGHSAWSFRKYGSSVFVLNDHTADCMMDITGAFGCAVRGMSLNGCNLGEGVHGIKLSWEEYNGGGEEDTPSLDDCRIGDFSGNGVHFEHVWCFSIRHSMICKNGGSGLYIDGWDGFILDNWFTANRKGGILGGPCAASLTATGNRVEWNSFAGFYLPSTKCCNITGNYFDRSSGPALVLGSDDGYADSVTVTGNLIYRNGKPSDKPFQDVYDSSHVRLTRCKNVVLSGNSFRLGRDDKNSGVWSPEYAVVIKDSEYCIVRDNVMHEGYLKEGIIMLDRNENVEANHNVGETKREDALK